ncbi:DHH family phosphoesterase [Candidatus Parcubacteria bacterium]|nr:DHH family phosphoesterase [Candidatus Parcubacteria bacterium]
MTNNNEIKNLKAVAQRIKEAIEKKENIILVADADLDGICSLILLKETIESLGGKVTKIYFPDREKEGYGLSEVALEKIKQFSPGLLLTLDLGITNFEEVKKAKEMGFFVIIVDHHEVIEKLPLADLIVDPKQPGDNYYFKNFATVGLAFKLAQEIFGEKMSFLMKKNFLELVSLATIADMMPQERENKLMIDEGLRYIENSLRPAFQALSIYFQLPKEIQKAISILNVREKNDDFPLSYCFLIAKSKKEAEEILSLLLERAKERKEMIKKFLEEIESKIDENEKIIFFGDEKLNFSVIPAIASQLCQEYQKPTFIYKKGDKESYGTVRSPPNINSIELMKKCKELLINFGGHPQASGFKIKNENLQDFKECLLKNL